MSLIVAGSDLEGFVEDHEVRELARLERALRFLLLDLYAGWL